jgi:spore coat polysaccharide biosynthesis protein SpsF
MGSSRLPGKMMLPLGDAPIIDWVICRVLASKFVDEVILVTSKLETEEPLLRAARRLGLEVHRGCEDDVLGRFYDVALLRPADNYLRICADNPFIAPEAIDDLIKHFLHSQSEYSCNHKDVFGSGYPDGFGAEIFSRDVLLQVGDITTLASHREHVTSYIIENYKNYRISVPIASEDIRQPHLRFDVDTYSDYYRLNHMVENGVTLKSTIRDILSIEALIRKEQSTRTDANWL